MQWKGLFVFRNFRSVAGCMRRVLLGNKRQNAPKRPKARQFSIVGGKTGCAMKKAEDSVCCGGKPAVEFGRGGKRAPTRESVDLAEKE
jgi:hypothetical protein